MRPFGNILVGLAVWLVFMCKIVTARPNDVMPRSNRSASSEVRFIAIGDWGQGEDDQRQIAKAMDKWCAGHRCDFVISTGDNFYPCGVNSVDDDFFNSRWRNMYNGPNLKNLKWHMCAGNHDHGQGSDCKGDNANFQIQYKNDRWHFPRDHYSFEEYAGTSKIKFISIDTQTIQFGDDSEIVPFVDKELNDPSAKWKVVFGHHPFYSAGHKDATRDEYVHLRLQILKKMERHHADIYLSGHDHNHQHWQKARAIDIDHIITGAGGKHLYKKRPQHQANMENKYGMKLKYFKKKFGFTYFIVTEKSIAWRVVSKDGKVLSIGTRHK